MTTETSLRKTEIPEEIQKDDTIPLEKKFITSPADVDRHRKVLLQDADIADEYREKFKNSVKSMMIFSLKDQVTLGKHH